MFPQEAKDMVQAAPPSSTPSRVAWLTYGTLLSSSFLYRAQIDIRLEDRWGIDEQALLRPLAMDAALALFIAALVQGLVWLGSRYSRNSSERARALVRRLGQVVGLFLLVCWGLLMQAHATLLVMGYLGVTAQAFIENLFNPAPLETLAFLSLGERAFILSPLLLLLLLHGPPRRLSWPRWVKRVLIALSALILGLSCLPPGAKLPRQVIRPPLLYLGSDLLRSAGALKRQRARRLEGSLPSHVAALEAPLFVSAPASEARLKYLPTAAGRGAYNVIFLILESVSVARAFEPIKDVNGNTQQAMPFLAALNQKGYSLGRHYSTSNTSSRSLFSIFSGLYCTPVVPALEHRGDIHLPSLVSYLPPLYHGELVTPGSLDWFFPRGFLEHAGFSAMWGYHQLPTRRHAARSVPLALDEAMTVDFFLERLDFLASSAAPFVAAYVSFVPHSPYLDCCSQLHLASPQSDLSKYYENLRLLDNQLERIFGFLNEKHLIDRTIVVIVGDHGEAFGEHPGNFGHSVGNFEVNYRVPALLYHPELFPARKISEATSHVDLVPTVLDALGVAHDSRPFQGESLYQEHLRRKYIFLFSGHSFTSISKDGVKLEVSTIDRDCRAYNLQTDPGEQHPLDCAPYEPQQQALLLYEEHQMAMLNNRKAWGEHGALVEPAATRPSSPHGQ